jgi:Ca2+:H+ antiporter
MPRWLYFLLIFAVLAPILELVHAPPLVIFSVAALGIVPLAALIGASVEGVAEHTGERIGGLLFATFGNATELIIGILALSQGLVDVVRASIIGTILGNTLLVLGVSVCIGGFKNGRLKFEARPASQYASLFALCVASLALPTIAELLATRGQQAQIVERGVLLSDIVAVVLLVGYIAFILFSVFHVGDEGEEEAEGEGEGQFAPVLGAYSVAAITRLVAYRRELAKSSITHKSGMLRQIDGTLGAIVAQEVDKQAASTTAVKPEPVVHKPPLWRSILFLSIATIGVAILSEILVGAIEPVTASLGWNPAFVGLVFLPLIGGLPEYFNTISMSLDKRMGMVLAASAGSSIQIALLVAPILVLLSIFMQKRLDLVFNIVELAVLGLATFLFSEITKDGELVWLEGLLLILLYAMMAGTVFLFG